MKTQQEIEEMKTSIQKQIEYYDFEIQKEESLDRIKNLRWCRIQYMAKYNILLEVLK